MHFLRALTFSSTALSVESDSGKRLYKFDRSLMERLADNGFPMSQINVQRRMRPTISHHIRYVFILARETLSLRFLPQNDPVPKAGGQRGRETLPGCEGDKRERRVLHARQQGRWWPGVGIQSQLVRGTHCNAGIHEPLE